ncbi:MAG TPA: class II fructose-bisphosphatase [Anaeromyxobacteraceae bacterium]|nr:class II fructose-bisphosphatase [Anaeromyxobacteraceae bacterium]
MDRNLALEVVRVTEATALASARFMGRGDRATADRAAAEAMRRAFQDIAVNAEVVIGQGEERAPVLHAGDRVGRGRDGDVEIEVAVDPLEGTTLCAQGAPGAMSVIAMGEKGRLLRPPETDLEKIVVGPGAKGVVDLGKPVSENLRRIADALGKYLEDLTVVVLDQPRHEPLLEEVRRAGARIKLIQGGGVAGSLATCFPETGVDVLVGVGGASEGVVTAAAVRCAGGDLQARFRFRSDAERDGARASGLREPARILSAEDLAGGSVMFAATGVTNGDILKGVRFTGQGARTPSVVMRSRTGTVRFIETVHRFQRFPDYGW